MSVPDTENLDFLAFASRDYLQGCDPVIVCIARKIGHENALTNRICWHS